MKVNKGFNLRAVCGEHIIVAEGDENIDFSNIISMNESSAYLWEEVQNRESFTVDSLVELLCNQYEIDEDTARKDATTLASQWAAAGIIEGEDIPEGEVGKPAVKDEIKLEDSPQEPEREQEQPRRKGFFKRIFG